MSYYPPSENGAKVNMIKQKFERKEKESINTDEQKESLRRSLSASPVKTKKILKLNVSRQLSNPGSKNIKRTPAFRGDKLTRTKNLQSPTRERVVSIVNQNVKIFEETPEYGKIGNVKKKDDTIERLESCSSTVENIGTSKSSKDWETKSSTENSIDRCSNRSYLNNSLKDTKSITRVAKKTDNCTVRTTVISRQKNISPIYTRDDEISKVNGKPETAVNNKKTDELLKFMENGVEYTKVMKQKNFVVDEKISKYEKKNSIANKIDIVDVREELSRGINRNLIIDDDSIDVIDGETNGILLANKLTENLGKKLLDKTGELSDTLKAALQAPLPAGPPPKKPPRTFVHSPIMKQANEQKCKFSCTIKSLDSDKIDELKSRDSKKMLEKLENVLIQHQKALGAKVIMPRKDKIDGFVTADRMRKNGSSTNDEDNKRSCFNNRLSRTLEDSKKLASLPNKNPVDSKTRKHSTFDCLPSLNCATWTSPYEQVRNPDFKSYFTESSSTRESQSSISKSEDSSESSISNLLSGNSEFFDEPAASKRLSTEFTTFIDAKKKQINPINNEERVYAEPFAFDQNSGTDITGYAMLSSQQHNYFSRSLQEERFGKTNDGFQFNEQRNSTDKLNRSDDCSVGKPPLHYMCTSIQPLVYEDNNNEPDADCASSKLVQRVSNVPRKSLFLNLEEDSYPVRTEPDKFNKIKVEELLNQAFGKFAMAGAETTPTDSNNSSDTDSLASTPSISSDQISSFNDKLQLFKKRENGEKSTKEELHRSLTEKRKNYVRRVSSKFSARREIGSFVSKRDKLFQVCLLVELDLSTRQPYIKDKYPAYAKTPAWIENFCFPDASDWPPCDSNQNQFYSLVLMDERGNRRYGYCCRVRPEDGPILPLAYCLITKYRASGFYHKVLLELESRHGMPDRKRTNFIEELYNSSMPKPGQSLRMTVDENDQQSSSKSTTESDDNKSSKGKHLILSKFTGSDEKMCSNTRKKTAHLSSALLSNERAISERMMDSLIDSDLAESIIVRSGDPRLEERDMSQLFDAVSNKVLIILFGSLLLERKVVLLCDKLSKLSSCVDALQSLLYPFTWPHTFIPVLPDIPGLSEILQAPLPFVIGILKAKNSANTDVAYLRDGIVVDLDTSKILYAVGDESSILPSRLQKGIRSALQLVYSHTRSGDGIRNFLVSEAFLRVLVETCSHCDSYLVTQQDGKIIFQKESFIKAPSLSKSVQYFLEWFVETTMFNTFIQDCITRMEGTMNPEHGNFKLFYQRAAEFRNRAAKSDSKNGFTKKKTLDVKIILHKWESRLPSGRLKINKFTPSSAKSMPKK